MFFSRPTTGKIILVLEIQSSIARSSLIWYKDAEAPTILFVDERAIPFKVNVGGAYFIKTALKALNETIDASAKRLHVMHHESKDLHMPKNIDEVHYVLSSPWIASQARTLSLSFDKNTTITKERISSIIADERKKLAPDSNGPLETVEEKIFDVRLNGYSVSSWEGKPAKQLEVTYAVTVGGADTMKRFRESCEHLVRTNRVHFHSSMLLQYVGIHSAMPERRSYTLVHIHGELTDVLAVKHGSCTFFGSYPMGCDTIVRKIAHSTKTDNQTADSLLSLYLGNKLDDSHTKETATLMADMSAGWSGELRKLFKEASLEGYLERDMIIVARAHEEFFVQSFKAAYPQANTVAWASSDIMPSTVFLPGVHRIRGISVYAIALRELW